MTARCRFVYPDATYRESVDVLPHGVRRRRRPAAPAGELLAPRGPAQVDAAKLMESTRVKRLPVVNDLGRLIGMATRRDLLRVLMRSDSEIRHEIEGEVARLFETLF
jgi:CBS domain